MGSAADSLTDPRCCEERRSHAFPARLQKDHLRVPAAGRCCDACCWTGGRRCWGGEGGGGGGGGQVKLEKTWILFDWLSSALSGVLNVFISFFPRTKLLLVSCDVYPSEFYLVLLLYKCTPLQIQPYRNLNIYILTNGMHIVKRRVTCSMLQSWGV